jgi:hypothetical protein
MSTPDYDFCFLGCGAASALHLLTHQKFFADKRVLILESAPGYELSRTFCSFSDLKLPVDGELAFQSFGASGIGFDRHFESAKAYRCVEARGLFAEFDKLLRHSPQMELRFGQRIEHLEQRGEMFWVSGKSVQFVFDSRPPKLSQRLWRQHFVGWEIEFENAQPLSAPVIMDINSRFQEGLKFFYLIPKTDRRLLVELTYFSEQIFDEAHYDAEIEKYIQSRGWKGYTIVGKERGVIPLVSIVPPANLPAHYRPLGVRAGNLRASTGYSVWRSLAQSRGSGPLLVSTFDLRWRLVQAMDRVFLKVLQLNPHRAGELFSRFFQGLEGEVIASFMSERPHWRALLRVIFVMPKWVFVKALFCKTPFTNKQSWRFG